MSINYNRLVISSIIYMQYFCTPYNADVCFMGINYFHNFV